MSYRACMGASASCGNWLQEGVMPVMSQILRSTPLMVILLLLKSLRFAMKATGLSTTSDRIRLVTTSTPTNACDRVIPLENSLREVAQSSAIPTRTMEATIDSMMLNPFSSERLCDHARMGDLKSDLKLKRFRTDCKRSFAPARKSAEGAFLRSG